MPESVYFLRQIALIATEAFWTQITQNPQILRNLLFCEISEISVFFFYKIVPVFCFYWQLFKSKKVYL